MMGGYYGGMGLGGGLLGIFYMLIPLALLGLIIYWAVKAAVGQGGSAKASSIRDGRRPVEIAEERYARGEISLEELQEIRRNLQKA